MFLVVIALFVVVLNNGYSQIRTQLASLKTTRNTENTLKTKFDKLREVSPGVINNSDSVIIALPDKNPGILMVSQMRLFSINNALTLTKVELKDSSKINDQLAKMQLSGEFEMPDLRSAVNFLHSLINSAPVSTLEELSVKSDQTGIRQGEIKISVYWADLPTQLPSLTEPFEELTEEEQNLLTKVAGFTQPEFTTLPPTSPGQRENPFN